MTMNDFIRFMLDIKDPNIEFTNYFSDNRSSPKCWCKLNSANLSFHKLKHTGFF